ncbi:MAG: hypothetical protein ACRYFZ_09565 [Janthinobacterium lividum]
MAAATPAPKTHKIRPKAGNAGWEHVTDEELAAITKQVGPRSFKAGYEVEALTEKAPKLPTVEASPKPEDKDKK